MNFTITSVGTAIHRRITSSFVPDSSWPPKSSWNPTAIAKVMREFAGVKLQEQAAQTAHKLSYDVYDGSEIEELSALLASQGIAAQVIFSGGQFLDFLPAGVDKGSALRHVAGTSGRFLIAADDSMNGAALLQAADLAILPGNAQASLKEWAMDPGNIPPQSCMLPAKTTLQEFLRACMQQKFYNVPKLCLRATELADLVAQKLLSLSPIVPWLLDEMMLAHQDAAPKDQQNRYRDQ